MQTYPGMPDVFTGTRVVKVTLTKDLPSSARVSGFDVRLWYQGQPQVCPVCRSYGHRVKDCPFNGLCRRCSQPGHMARECSFRRTSVDPAVSSVPDPVAGADPSISEDEADPDYVPSSASEPGSCSGDEEVLRSVPTSVLAARVRKRSAPPAVPSDESSVDLRDNELSPVSELASTVPGTPESASAVVAPESGSAPAVPDPVPGTPVSASAVAVPDGTPVSASAESSGSKPKKKKPRSSQSAVASSLAKFFSVKSNPVKSDPVKSTPVQSSPVESTPVESTPAESASVESSPVAGSPPVSFWEASRRTGFGYVIDDGCSSSIRLDFGRLSRSIEIESTSFEYDRFVKYVHHGFGRVPFRAPHTTYLPAGTPLEFPKPPK